MYCPRCGDELTKIGKILYCEKGDMEFSENLTNRFIECFELKTRIPKDLRFSFVIGGSWFCPLDRNKMIENNGYLKCQNCNLTLNEFIHTLVERHIHK